MENQPTHCHPGAKYIGGIQEDEWNVYCHGRACSAQSSPYLGTSTALSSCTEHALKHCPLTTKLGWTRQAQDKSETHTHTNTPILCKDPSPTYISVTSKCNLQKSTQSLVCDTVVTKEPLLSCFIRVPNNHIHHKQNDLDHNRIIDSLEVGISAHKLTGENSGPMTWYIHSWRRVSSNSLCERVLHLEHTYRPSSAHQSVAVTQEGIHCILGNLQTLSHFLTSALPE